LLKATVVELERTVADDEFVLLHVNLVEGVLLSLQAGFVFRDLLYGNVPGCCWRGNRRVCYCRANRGAYLRVGRLVQHLTAVCT
jgi:hypothetical protein